MSAATATRLRTLAGARVGDAMTSGVVSCSPETCLRTVARIMAERGVHAVFVFDYGEPWLTVTDLDVAAAAVDYVDAHTAGESAVVPLVTVRSDDELAHAAALMAENAVSHLAVIDPLTERPVGVVSTLDIAGVLSGT
ncbi:MAG: CBS domain-containing protein [Gaiellaceae bacterium]